MLVTSYDAAAVLSDETAAASTSDAAAPSDEAAATSGSRAAAPTEAGVSAATSYFGKVSPLSTGALFPSPRGIVDALPRPDKPCLLFADHDPLAAVAHICLLEKEAEANGGMIPHNPKLFTVVHVCEPLANRDDPGMRIVRKLGKQRDASLQLPVLIHEGNVFQEGRGGRINNVDGAWWSGSACLLPDYIDGAIGKKHSLRPDDAVGVYNMNLFLQRHADLPALFHKLLTHPSQTQRIQRSKELLALLKLIDADLQKFEGLYLCGQKFTLADAVIFPIIERIVLVLSAYRSFWIPPSLHHLINWYDTVLERPAIRAATSDRTRESQNTYCYEKVRRSEYLVEVYESAAGHEEDLFRELNERSGSPGVNVYRQEAAEDARDRSVCESKNCQHCVIC
ncbi:hypothetical protein ACHAXT_010520 [Thalassiosira profunda]